MPERESARAKEEIEAKLDISATPRDADAKKAATQAVKDGDSTPIMQTLSTGETEWLAQTAAIKRKHRIQACEKLGFTWNEFEGQERLLAFATSSGLPIDDDVIEAITKMRVRIDEIASELFVNAPSSLQRLGQN